MQATDGTRRSFADLHSHSSASFDSLADPRKMMAKAVRLGLTHLAITDHERIDGAQAASTMAPPGLQVGNAKVVARKATEFTGIAKLLENLDGSLGAALGQVDVSPQELDVVFD